METRSKKSIAKQIAALKKASMINQPNRISLIRIGIVGMVMLTGLRPDPDPVQWPPLQGTIVDTQNQPVAFATLRIVTRNIGVYASESGTFSIPLEHPSQADTLQVTAVGFAPNKIPCLPLDKPKTIVLAPLSTELPEVTVRASSSHESNRTFGYYQRIRGVVTHDLNLNTASTMATFVANPEQRPGRIKQLLFRLTGDQSDIAKTFKVQLHVLAFQPQKPAEPGEDRLHRPVLVDLQPELTTLSYPLEDNVEFPSEGVWVALEVIGYYNKQGNFITIQPGQYGFIPIKQKNNRMLAPSVAMSTRSHTEGQTKTLLTAWKPIREYTPMFGLTAIFLN